MGFTYYLLTRMPIFGHTFLGNLVTVKGQRNVKATLMQRLDIVKLRQRLESDNIREIYDNGRL